MQSTNAHWQPTADFYTLHLRAAIIDKIRAFFAARQVLEVETPLLSHATVTDPHIQSFETLFLQPGKKEAAKLYLQTSPEFAMKRLLAAGIGPIYQICKAFRNEESGRLHNPEFTMLEWYRPGFDHHQLMDEMDALLHHVLEAPPAKRLSYQALFLEHLLVDPHQASITELEHYAKTLNLQIEGVLGRDDWLHLLMTHFIEPKLKDETSIFVYDFPASQAALARIRPEKPPVAERFEVYVKGVEIANGYHELSNAKEQDQRFERDLQLRNQLNRSAVPKDNRLIAALSHGLPNCAGVALGVDRLIMLMANQKDLSGVISFPFHRA